MSLNLKEVLNKGVKVTVQIVGDPQPVKVPLNLNDSLSNIRKELKENIDDTLLFARKIHDKYVEIESDFEKVNILDDIIDKRKMTLYLVKNPLPNWKVLNEQCRLEYGRTMTFDRIKKADKDKQAFTMKNCKVTKIGTDGCLKGYTEFNSNEDRMMKTELSFGGEVEVQDFVKIGLSLGTSKNKNSKVENNSICDFTNIGKASLNFELVPTPNFIDAVKGAKSIRDFRNIIEEYGQFISTDVVLGGRAYFEGVENLKESYKGSTMNPSATAGNIKIEHTSEYSSGNTNYSKRECFKLIGGKRPGSLKDFDEESWIESLDDFTNWDCIEYRNPISIFQLLPDDYTKKIFQLIGKKIHYSHIIEDCEYPLELGPRVFALEIPPKILKIIERKNSDCNIFATAIDTEVAKNDTFYCQILQDGEQPRLLIHCIQVKFKTRRCKLKIGWMVIGNDVNFTLIRSDLEGDRPDIQFVQLDVRTIDFNASSKPQSMDNKKLLGFEYDPIIEKVLCFGIPVLKKLDPSNSSLAIGHHFFNDQKNNKNEIGSYTFSYCLKRNHHVSLPDFTFCTFIISNQSNGNYGILSDGKVIMSNSSPNYISLNSIGKNNCGPIFLKQKPNEIKIKHNKCNNSKHCCVCKNKPKNDLKYASFDPLKPR